MHAAEIRSRFIQFFEDRGHEARPSSSLVPGDDPTLLFTNAGMNQFKGVFLGQEETPFRRAVTAQKCVRAGGKHNDLEEVGRTARHHTFFEMLGNFSFGDYFKRDAIRFAWEFLTEDLGMDPERIYATVHHSDDEAAELWVEVAGLPRARIYRLGDKDNFWQMADTGPCGPCSELHYDLRPEAARGRVPSVEEFEALAESGQFLELWNLVFMQYDRDATGTLDPLPAPSIDTGAGLERLAAVLQHADSNYHTDLFQPFLDRVAAVVGRPYEADGPDGVSYRVLADHARAVAFLLADGVFPSSEGRGYVLRRILRRGVRHAWLIGRREPTLVDVVAEVIEQMKDAYPELAQRRDHILATTLAEEERFFATIDRGMKRFDEVAPALPAERARRVRSGEEPAPKIAGEDAFRLYDTDGFPLDLIELMAGERGYDVDGEGFQEALEGQRRQSREARGSVSFGDAEGADTAGLAWRELEPGVQEFTGYEMTIVESDVLAYAELEAPDSGRRLALQLARNPFYAEGGGQISDVGSVTGAGWSMVVDRVARVANRVTIMGAVTGIFPDAIASGLTVRAEVAARRRHDTERNHTATHLLHAALRGVLGTHVVQRGSLVAPDRLRFDFAHASALTEDELREVEIRVNDNVWDDLPVETGTRPYAEAVASGAMALFGEKYGDEVRVVEVPHVSVELCGGTHVRRTGEISMLRILSETGVAAGVRRIEAVTGPGVFAHLKETEGRLASVSDVLRSTPDNVSNRAARVLEENAQLEALLSQLRAGGGAGETLVQQGEVQIGASGPSEVRVVHLMARDAEDVRKYGDTFRSDRGGVAVVGAEYADGKLGLFTFVSDDLVGRGLRADHIVREVATRAGGSGGGRPHMAQAGVADRGALDAALLEAVSIVTVLAAKAGE